ncbi:hypothetical protein BGY98DRAFT_1053546 [Russula aff. rugulosa BPL654]|nr:hypothetical protein BGY98DRAFT_1053546 [Russula aff. rugulosa BPL654]
MRESWYRWYLQLRGMLGVSAPRLNQGLVAILKTKGGGLSVQDGQRARRRGRFWM